MKEEFIESEPESPVEFPDVNQRGDKPPSSKSQYQKLNKTQPLQNLAGGHNYNTINTTSVSS